MPDLSRAVSSPPMTPRSLAFPARHAGGRRRGRRETITIRQDRLPSVTRNVGVGGKKTAGQRDDRQGGREGHSRPCPHGVPRLPTGAARLAPGWLWCCWGAPPERPPGSTSGPGQHLSDDAASESGGVSIPDLRGESLRDGRLHAARSRFHYIPL